MKKASFLICLVGFAAFGLVSCSEDHASSMAESSSAQTADFYHTKMAKEQSSLTSMADAGVIGTQRGGSEKSHSQFTNFQKLNSKPDGLLVMDYRDEKEFSTRWLAKVRSMNDSQGLVKISIVGDWGGFFPICFSKTQKPVLLGESGKEYSIEIENVSAQAVMVVVSVDGLSTFGGQKASYKSPGYVIYPGKKQQIRGWSNSWGSLSRFKFGNVDASVAAQSGMSADSARDIGVMGFAVFRSKTAALAGTRGRPFVE